MLSWSCLLGVLCVEDIHCSLMTFSQVVIAVANGKTTLKKKNPKENTVGKMNTLELYSR